MASDIPPHADHSRLFSDPAELARGEDAKAQKHMDRRCVCDDDDLCNTAMEIAQGRANRLRRMARNGEQMPEF